MSGQILTRFATAADQPALLEFIRAHWAAQHVFVQAPAVFDWQYLQADGRLNMVLAEQADEILGVLGFIPTGRHDAGLGDADILLALWKVRETGVPPGLGLRLLKFIQAQLQPRLIGAIGISEMVGPIYRALGYSLGALQQAAIFNPDARGRCRIAQNVPEPAFAEPAFAEPAFGAGRDDSGGYSLAALTTADHADLAALAAAGTPQKSLAYVQDRYLNHPWYEYTLRMIRRDGVAQAVAVWRRQQANGSHILRIVDIIGAPGWLAHGTALLRPDLAQDGAEYIDLMQYGSPPALLQAGGWFSPDETPGLILPNYFAPFEARNVPIKLAFRQFNPSPGALHLYRADSDQDRPNQLPLPDRSF